MPANTGASFVIIQHLSPDFRTMMDQLLEKFTDMPILIVEERLEVKPNHIYILSPGKSLLLDGGFLVTKDKTAVERFGQPINDFFHSMALDDQIRSIAVILSGTGSDGTLGIKSVYASGGLVLVQDPDDAQFDGMPMNAIATGVADLVAEVHVLSTTLSRYLKASENDGMALTDRLEDHHDDMQDIYSLLLEETGIDFSFYKIATISRRLEHRMGLNQINRLSDYIALLKNKDADELWQLKQILLINVTQFFRDMSSYDQLNEKVIEPLLVARKPHDVIRIWSIGCSTGEEPYSLAIMLHETAQRLKLRRKIKIFSTDVDEKSVNTAMLGLYPESIVSEVPDYYIRNHFSVDAGGMYRIREHIRHMVVFARHDVLKDPPFSNIDLVVCRNMLIYFQPVGQQKTFKAIEFSLRQGGHLFLGKAEAPVSGYENLGCISYSDKIYEKSGQRVTNGNEQYETSTAYSTHKNSVLARYQNTNQINKRHSLSPVSEVQSRNVLLLHVTEQLFDQQLAPTVILDLDYGIIKSYGSLSPWMKDFKPGESNTHIRDVFKSSVANYLASAVEKVSEENKTVNYQHIAEGDVFYTLSVTPLENHHPDFPVVMICSFILESASDLEKIRSQDAINIPVENATNERMQVLEKELQSTRNNLILSQRELETISAQLQTSNEELMASNEELQGTNEELQSVNEELHTLNSEYQQKINELTSVNNDLDNFMKSTEIAAIFLDQSYRIRRYTQPFSKYINILPVDINRSFLDLKMAFQFNQAEEAFQKTLKSGEPSGGRVKLSEERYAIYKIIPYYGVNKSIDGIVIIINEDPEINAVMHDMKILDSVYKKNKLVSWEYDLSTKAFIFKKDNELNLPETNKKVDFYRTIPDTDRSKFIDGIENVIESGEDFELTHQLKLPQGETHHFHSMAFSYINKNGDVERVFGLLQDISDQVINNEKIDFLQSRLNATFNFFPFPVSVIAEDLTFTYTNAALQKYSGYTADELTGESVNIIKPEDETKQTFDLLGDLVTGKTETLSAVRKFLHKSGDISDIYVRSTKLPETPNQPIALLHVFIPLEKPTVIDVAGGEEIQITSQKTT